jgi:protocatechuate 3,4-dioxygenase beta subunit
MLFGIVAALAADAGVVRGIVQERISGRPLARTIVRLTPVPKSSSEETRPVQARTGPAGQFLFLNVPDGLYLLTSVRSGYFPASYGQRRPAGQGIPLQVTHDSDLFTQLQMRHMGAITGRVLDENGIGIEGAPVVAYRARLPLRAVGRAVSDDRGVYRIPGLDPGRYWVRSAAHQLDEGSGRLPTFGPESRETVQARVHVVTLDSDTPDADIRTEPGSLFRLSGKLQCLGGQVIVTLSSETGRKTTQAPCNERYTFDALAPALYEVFAVVQGGGESGFVELFVDRDSDNGSVRLMPPPRVDFEVFRSGSGKLVSDVPISLTGRRQDLSEIENERKIDLPRATLEAGHWEMTPHVGPGQYVESIVTSRGQVRRSLRTEPSTQSFDVFVEMQMYSGVRITVSDRAAQISGTVTSDAKPVPGAPVFLWPMADAARRSLKGPRQMLTDTQGRYLFEGLPPGDYRLLATFDLSEVDEIALDEARAAVIHVDGSQKAAAELTLWIPE